MQRLDEINRDGDPNMHVKRAAKEWYDQCLLLPSPPAGVTEQIVTATYAGKHGATTAKKRNEQEDKKDDRSTALCYLFPESMGMTFVDRLFFLSSDVFAVADTLKLPPNDVHLVAETVTEVISGGLLNCAHTGIMFGGVASRINVLVSCLIIGKFGAAVVAGFSKEERKRKCKELRASLLAGETMKDDIAAMKIIRNTTVSDVLAASMTLDELLSKLCSFACKLVSPLRPNIMC